MSFRNAEGAPIGIVLNFSLLTKISEHQSSILIKNILSNCEYIDFVNDLDIDSIGETKSFCKWNYFGFTDSPYELVSEIKDFKTANILHWSVSVSYNDIDDEVQVFSDNGRLLRPVFNVENEKLKFKEEEEQNGMNW